MTAIYERLREIERTGPFLTPSEAALVNERQSDDLYITFPSGKDAATHLTTVLNRFSELGSYYCIQMIIYRRFFDENDLGFPLGTVYRDIPSA